MKGEETSATGSKPPIPQGNLIFALDIGTHSVIGVVGQKEGEMFRVLDIRQMEYPRKAMRDGQIEDIETVAATARQVREQLEESLGFALEEVYVAAAGRSLQACKIFFEMELPAKGAVTAEQIADLEKCVIQQAEQAVAEKRPEAHHAFYYIGHSVMHYYLDGYAISNLLDHRGSKIGVDAIVTFLPAEVLESLHAAMRKAGLSVKNVTLEPIAAMNAIIPQELRLLNLALVDIGAGTSDVAVSEGGSVAAYTMATVAGDEITEGIAHAFLVDTQVAEEMKIAFSRGEEIQFEDILGFGYTVSNQEFGQRIEPVVHQLVETICGKILEANGKAPAAVFLVGGGSRLPNLAQMVAECLSMDCNKVAVGGNNYMKRMVASPIDISGPEYATPMGIALTAAKALDRQRYTVTLNGETVQITNQKTITVMELLLLCGYRREQLMGRSGKGVTYQLNGVQRVARGKCATPAILLVGGKPASVFSPVQPGDVIQVTPSTPGQDANPCIGDVVENVRVFSITVDGVTMPAGRLVSCNGGPEPAPADRRVQMQDVLTVRELLTVEQLYAHLGLDPAAWSITMDGTPLQPAALLQEGAVLVTQPREEPPTSEGAETGEIAVFINGRQRMIPPKEDGSPHQFLDMLNFVDIDPSQPQGKIVLGLNGQSASYLDIVRDQDRVDIHWEDPED